ncbi:hypothetical protein D7W79_40125 [Corallococcus exercitus]|uniref:DUF2642 domain-containing protein n=1 Tax=Corallococcus exercitus TaxID=2316736 RepID=A0A3A8GXV2_9BACT|nr:hypothetical protein [Corallococcus exercitus]NOK32070.1 hypothetical protein [Corallococcus exercitus]RKG63569.1 hypothetical protein D7W79_40125 [Corallococcus exercitus]
MRKLLEASMGQRCYLFTTLGQVYVGLVVELIDDVVHLTGPDGITPVYINLSDVSGVRQYDEDDDLGTAR